MVHGDFKQGNMFFDNGDDTSTEAPTVDSSGDTSIAGKQNEGDKIAVFDWQWTGPGIGATDLVYLCVMAVSNEALEDYEANILKPYHNHLIRALNRRSDNSGESNNHQNSDYPYHELLDEFKLAAIDIQRWLGGSRFKSMNPESMRRAQQNIDVNHGIFRRSIDRLVWIFRTVDRALEDIESGRIRLNSSPTKS